MDFQVCSGDVIILDMMSVLGIEARAQSATALPKGVVLPCYVKLQGCVDNQHVMTDRMLESIWG
jgi:hypothetical protein